MEQVNAPEFRTCQYVAEAIVNGNTQASATTDAPSCTNTATTASPVGTYPIMCAQGTLAAANYSFKFETEKMTITKAVLTVTANSLTIVYGTPIPTLTCTITGFMNGDTVAGAITGVCSLSTTAKATSPVAAPSTKRATLPASIQARAAATPHRIICQGKQNASADAAGSRR